MSNKTKLISLNSFFAIIAVGFFVLAGNLNPSSAPGDTMHTLEDIYCKYADCVPAVFGLNSTSSVQATMHTTRDIYDVIDTEQYGRGWIASTTGTDATTSLTMAVCIAASSTWQWFEDANGDGDTTDPEDGICVRVTTVAAGLSWNGYDYTTNRDNSYIAGYTCEGSFPTGHVKVGTYNGLTSAGAADTTWNSGDCALCEADCYDGRRDLPAQGTYTANVGGTAGYQGPLTPDVLKKWKGTRLPSMNDFFGYCGYKDGGSDYTTGCSSATTTGSYGTMIGRTDECLDLSNSSTYEWLSEQISYDYARVAGISACSFSGNGSVYVGYRFRAVFRP